MEGNQELATEGSKVVEPNSSRWIEDEGFLRDDGVLFGYTNASPDEKLDAIDHYYQSQSEPHNVEVAHIEEEESILMGLIDICLLPGGKPDVIIEKNTSIYFVRNLVGLLIVAGTCFFNYFLILNDLRPLSANSQLISLGIYLFGLFMIFAPKSILFHYEEENTPRTKSKLFLYLLEFGAPLVSAFFVAYVVYSNQKFVTAVIHFVFIFSLFVIPGKLFLSLFKQSSDDLKQIRLRLRHAKINKDEINSALLISENNRKKLTELNIKLEDQKSKKLDLQKKVAKLEEEKESKKKIFMSEYHLAKAFSQKLNTKPTINLLTEYNAS